jgi:hypothetical protein
MTLSSFPVRRRPSSRFHRDYHSVKGGRLNLEGHISIRVFSVAPSSPMLLCTHHERVRSGNCIHLSEPAGLPTDLLPTLPRIAAMLTPYLVQVRQVSNEHTKECGNSAPQPQDQNTGRSIVQSGMCDRADQIPQQYRGPAYATRLKFFQGYCLVLTAIGALDARHLRPLASASAAQRTEEARTSPAGTSRHLDRESTCLQHSGASNDRCIKFLDYEGRVRGSHLVRHSLAGSMSRTRTGGLISSCRKIHF